MKKFILILKSLFLNIFLFLKRRSFLILWGIFLFGFWYFYYKNIWNGTRHVGWDLDGYNYPLDAYLFKSLKESHTIPQWYPYIYNGIDFIGNIQAAIFYLPKLIFFGILILFNKDLSYKAYQELNLFHVYLFSIFTFYAAKKITKNNLVAAFASISIPYSGFMQGQMQHFWFFTTVAWAPLAFVGFYKGVLNKNKKAFVLYIVSSALMIMAGFPNQFTTLFLALWGISFIYILIEKKYRSDFINISKRFLTSLLFIIGLIAIEITPFVFLIKNSSAVSHQGPMPEMSAQTLLFADKFGHISGNLTQPWDRSTSYYYLGLTTFSIPFVLIYLIAFRFKKSNLKLITLLTFFSVLTYIITFTKVIDRLYDFSKIFGAIRPWLMVTVLVTLVNLIFITIFFAFSRINKITYALTFLIILISGYSLLINRPGFFNTAEGEADFVQVKNVINFGDKESNKSVVADKDMYSVLIDQSIVGGSFDNWPRILELRSLSGHDPTVQRDFLKTVSYGKVLTNGKRLELTTTPDFNWLADNGVKYFIGGREKVSLNIEKQFNLKLIYSNLNYFIWELPNPRKIFSSENNCAQNIIYEQKVNQIELTFDVKQDNCVIRSTSNYSKYWKVAGSSNEIIKKDKGLGYEIKVNKDMHSLKLKYTNPYFFVGAFISLISTLALAIYFFIPSPKREEISINILKK